MTERVQLTALAVLGWIASTSLWAAFAVIDRAKAPEVVQAGLAMAAITSNVVTGIAGFMVGRAVTRVAAPVGELVGTPAGAAPIEEQP